MIKICSYEKCLRTYGTSDGGQYGGLSKAVLVIPGKDGKPDEVRGFCSAKCSVEFQGHTVEKTLAFKYFKELGEKKGADYHYTGEFPAGFHEERRLTSYSHSIVP